jgi:alpha-glucoside transport system substrate-binding protein
MQDFARDGQLISLSQCEGLEDLVRENYPESWIELGSVDGELYGFFMKADTKGTIWYSPTAFEEASLEPLDADASFDDLVALSQEFVDAGGVPPWSMGMEEAQGTGFPGSDWIQQIILNSEGGPELYDGLIDGSIPFTDERVKAAWESFGEIALTEGFVLQSDAAAINATNFRDAVYPPFQSPPEAAMVYLGGFAEGFIIQQFPDAVPGETYDFFTFPGGGITGGANVVYAFNNDPGTCAFMTYLAGAEAQQIWVERGGFTSVNTSLDTSAYPNEIAARQAEQLIEAESFRFDLDDAIGGALQQAYFQGVTQYLADPGSLDGILESIEAARGTE